MRRLFIFLQPFLEPGTIPVLFIVGVILLSLISSALYDLMRSVFATVWIVLLVAVGLFFLFLIGYVLVLLLLKPRLVVTEITRRRGLIVLVSQGQLSQIPACAAIKYHYRGEHDVLPEAVLEHLWLVTSPKPIKEPLQRPGDEAKEPFQSAWKNALDLKRRYLPLLSTAEVEFIDPEDPQNIFETIEQIYSMARDMRLRPNQIVADFTGGTKMMTTGMVLACTPSDRDVEYMKPRRFLPDGRADPSAGADPRLVDLSFYLRTGKDMDTGD